MTRIGKRFSFSFRRNNVTIKKYSAPHHLLFSEINAVYGSQHSEAVIEINYIAGVGGVGLSAGLNRFSSLSKQTNTPSRLCTLLMLC